MTTSDAASKNSLPALFSILSEVEASVSFNSHRDLEAVLKC